MVKFQVRMMKKRYKKKQYTYTKYVLEFPAEANPQIEPHKTKTFDAVHITSEDTPKQELLNIQLVRNKPLGNQQAKLDKASAV